MRVALITTVLACIALAGTALAADITWDGNGDSNNDGDWSVGNNWDTDTVPGELDTAILPAVTGNGNTGTNTRTIIADDPISVGKVNVATGSGGYTNLVQVNSQLTAAQCLTGGDLHLGIAAGATFTLGNDLNSQLPVLRGSGAFVKVGTGTVTVLGFACPGDAWTGTMDIQEGTLYQGGYTRLGNASMLTVQSGAMYSNDHSQGWDKVMGSGLTLNGAGIDGAGALKCGTNGSMFSSASLTLPTDSTINVSNAAGVLSISGAVSGPGALTKIGDGKLVLGTGWLGGVEIAEGTLQIGGKLTSDIHIAAGAKLMAAEAQVIGTVTVDEGGTWDKSVAASWVGPAGDPNDDGDWHVADNWSAGALPSEATLPAVTGNGSSENNTRTITVTADEPISVDKIIVPTESVGYTNLVQVNSQFTVAQCLIPGGGLHLGIAAGATFTLGNDLKSQLPALRGSGAFVKVGTDTVEVGWQPGDTWTGTMDIQEGTLYQGSYTRLGNTSMVTVQLGAMYSIGNTIWDRPMGSGLTLNGTGIDGEGALKCSTNGSMFSSASLALPTDSTINVSNAGAVLSISGAVSGPGALTKIGDGKLVLGTGWLGGVEIAEGTLQIGGKLTSDIHIAAGAKLMAAEAQVIGTVTGDGTWDKSVAASWVGPAGDPNDDGDWHVADNWSAGALPTEATLPAVTGNGSSENNTRTITVTADEPISVDKIIVPTESVGYTNLVQVNSQFTVAQCLIPGGGLHLGIAAGATFTLGNDLKSQLPALRGSGAFVKVGTDTVEVGWQPGDTWTGTMDIQEGTLYQGSYTRLGNTSMVTVQLGAMYSIGNTIWDRPMGSGLTLNGTGIDGEGALKCSTNGSMFSSASLALPTDSTINVSNAAGVLTIGGAVSGPGKLTKIGLGKLVLGTGWLGGVEIAEGTLQIGGKLTSDIHIAAGAKLMAAEAQVIGTVTWDEGGIWDKSVAASWVGPAGNSNDDGDWHVADNWSAGALPTEATLPAVTGNGIDGNNIRTITVTADEPISVGKVNVPTDSPGYTNLVQVNSQLTAAQCVIPGAGLHVGIAADATFTLGNNLNSQLPTLRGSGAFVKVGTGTVEVPGFACPGDAWTGTMDIREGTLYQGGYTRLGNASMLTVQSGAMYSNDHSQGWDKVMGSGLTLNGTGISGAGALKCGTSGTMFTSASLTLPTDSTINVSNAAGVLTIGGAVSGPGLLTKTGYGTLSLAATCATDIAVARGTLAIEDDFIDDDKVLAVSMGAKLDVAEFADEHVAQLFFNGEPQKKGSWGKTDSGADHINDLYFAGRTGIVTVDTSLTLDGDVNGDCVVNILDLIGIRNHLNQDPTTPAENAAYDVNEDGSINILDMIYVRNRLNTKCEE